MGAFEDMIIGSPESRAEVRVRLQAPPRWPVLWWMVLAASVLVTSYFVGWVVALLVDLPPSADPKRFAVIGLFLVIGHMALVPASIVVSRLRACASNRSVRRRCLAAGLTLAAVLLAVDTAAIWTLWQRS